jgi:hypothetical protein
MKARSLLPILLLIGFVLGGCEIFDSPNLPPADNSPTSHPVPTTPQTKEYSTFGLNDAEAATLLSLVKLDEYPLYSMHYYADYPQFTSTTKVLPANLQSSTIDWACSLFSAFADPENMLYGRNFDWDYSPALLLHTDPPDGYASVSMVDIAYFWFQGEDVNNLTDQPLDKIVSLLDAPLVPFDGLNEVGLAVGMAAVPPGDMRSDPQKPTITSLGIIRQLLDYASTVDEAIEIIGRYNIDFEGGPPIHYLIADRTGQAVLVEYYQGEMHIIRNQSPWHQATNYLVSAVGDTGGGYCWRYDAISQSLRDYNGSLTPQDAVKLLEKVSQDGTQWSIVYNMSTGEVQIVMGQNYHEVHVWRPEW